MSAPDAKHAPPAHRGARFAIVVVGAIGVVIAARTAAFYFEVDRVAFALCLLIAGGLSGGILELLGRVARAERIEAELARLPRPATLETIDATSPPLRSVLRARLTGVRATVATAGFAPYLIGLLVMVGLLGTFLGLVEALRGTRDALGASSDIEALRTALSTPMLGLSRAFGTSAAGVAASAMLGLASVFARRAEVSLAHAVHAYGDDALGPLTVAERQLAVLEALVRQSAEATAAAARSTQAVEATAAALRADVAAGVADVGRAVERALTPALERAVARASDVTAERLADWTRVVEREADERRARDTALASAWSEVAGESAERVAREGARVLGELRGALGESLSALDGRLGASIDALAGQLGARNRAVTDDLEMRLATLTTTVDVMVKGLAGELDATRLRLDRTLDATTHALETHAERTAVRERAREDAMDARASVFAASEAQALTRLERHVEAVDAALATHLARMTAMHADVGKEAAHHAVALEVVLREHAAGLTTHAGAVLSEAARSADAVLTEAARSAGAVLSEAARSADATSAAAERVVRAARDEIAAREASERAQAARADAVLSGLAAAAEQISVRTGHVLSEQAERQAELEARWLAAHDASNARVVALLEQHAHGLASGLSATQALVDDAAGLLRASGVEMGAVAEVFTGAVDRYRDASAASLEALAGLDDAVDRAGKKAAIDLLTDYLDQTREVFEHSLELQRELFEELRALRRAASPSESTRVRS